MSSLLCPQGGYGAAKLYERIRSCSHNIYVYLLISHLCSSVGVQWRSCLVQWGVLARHHQKTNPPPHPTPPHPPPPPQNYKNMNILGFMGLESTQKNHTSRMGRVWKYLVTENVEKLTNICFQIVLHF